MQALACGGQICRLDHERNLLRRGGVRTSGARHRVGGLFFVGGDFGTKHAPRKGARRRSCGLCTSAGCPRAQPAVSSRIRKEGPLDQFDFNRPWPAVAAAVILLLARAAKAPSLGSPFARVPVRWRPHVVLALGVLSGVLDAVVAGTPWLTAIGTGLLSAAVAIAMHGAAGGVNPQPESLPLGWQRVTAPAGSVVTVEATVGEEGAPPAPRIPAADSSVPPVLVASAQPAGDLDFRGAP